MEKLEKEMMLWGESLIDFHLPRWDELPVLELYMDQLITLIEQYLSPMIQSEKHALLTSSMVNNYVKQKMIPKPQKKRYNRKHVAFLIAITLLKQVLTIPEIKNGILFQGKVVGIRNAYDLFCKEQEAAIQSICHQAMGRVDSIPAEEIPITFLAVKAATRSFANKLLAEKTIELEYNFVEMDKGEYNE